MSESAVDRLDVIETCTRMKAPVTGKREVGREREDHGCLRRVERRRQRVAAPKRPAVHPLKPFAVGSSRQRETIV